MVRDEQQVINIISIRVLISSRYVKPDQHKQDLKQVVQMGMFSQNTIEP